MLKTATSKYHRCGQPVQKVDCCLAYVILIRKMKEAIERKRTPRKAETPAPPDYSTEGVRRIVETTPPAQRLYSVWYLSELAVPTPEIRERRRSELERWESELSPKEQQMFHADVTTVGVEGKEQEVGLGFLIRRLATDDARKFRSAQQAAELEAKRIEREKREAEARERARKSKGIARHERRMKAQERRGTSPRDIH